MSMFRNVVMVQRNPGAGQEAVDGKLALAGRAGVFSAGFDPFNRGDCACRGLPASGRGRSGISRPVAGAAEFDQELATVLAGIAQLDMTAHAATKLRVRKQALAAIHEAIQLESASYAA